MPVAQKQATTAWPDGSTWVYVATIASDAGVGTHVCTATIVPGTGQEMQILYGRIVLAGAAALAESVVITDTVPNTLALLQNGTTAGAFYFPFVSTAATATAPVAPLLVTGGMKIVMTCTTSTVSQTQTFAIVCRLRSPKLPTVTLADSVGTPTPTVSTNAIFGA